MIEICSFSSDSETETFPYKVLPKTSAFLERSFTVKRKCRKFSGSFSESHVTTAVVRKARFPRLLMRKYPSRSHFHHTFKQRPRKPRKTLASAQSKHLSDNGLVGKRGLISEKSL